MRSLCVVLLAGIGVLGGSLTSASAETGQGAGRDVPLVDPAGDFSNEGQSLFYDWLADLRDADPQAERETAIEFLEARRRQLIELQDLPDQPFPLYLELFRNPVVYHGQPLPITGNIQKVIPFPAGENEHGLETLYEVWMYTSDSDSNPLIVVTANVPDEIPRGDNLVLDAAVTALFLKVLEFGPDGELQAAPLLVGGELQLLRAGRQRPTDLNPAILEPVRVRDRYRGVRDAERDGYYRILRIVADGDLALQKQAARELLQTRRALHVQNPENRNIRFSRFRDLFENPEAYHGQLVTLTGHVGKLVSYPAGENRYGIETLYEAWLYTDDSQQNPAVVVCTSIPEGMPMGETVVEQVSVTGYFFKMYHYTAQDTARLAPMILAHQLQWTPEPESRLGGPIPVWVYVTVVAGMLAVIFGLWKISQKDRAFREQRLAPLLKGEVSENVSAAEADADQSTTDFLSHLSDAENDQHQASDGDQPSPETGRD